MSEFGDPIVFKSRDHMLRRRGGGGGSDDTGIGWKVNTRQKGICGLDIHDSRDFVHIILVNRGYLSIIRIRKKRDCFY